MLLNSFKSLRPTTFGFLIVIGLGLWLFPLFGILSPIFSAPAPLYSLFLYWLDDLPYLALLISLALVIVESIMLNTLVIEHQLFSRSTYIPALFYILLMCSIPEALNLHPFLFCNFFIIKTLDKLFSAYKKEQVNATYFDAGFFLSLAVLFYYPAFFLLPIVFISLILFRSFEWREWTIAILGHVTPYLFLFTYTYSIGAVESILFEIPPFSFLFTELPIIMRPSFYVLAIALMAITGYSFKSVFYNIKGSKIKARKMFATLFWLIVLVIVMVISFSSYAIYSVTILSIPMAIYFSAFFIDDTKKVSKEIIFILLFSVIVYVQIVNL